MNSFTSQRAWNKFKKRFTPVEEQRRRSKIRRKKFIRRALQIIIFLVIPWLVYNFWQKIAGMFQSILSQSFDSNFFLTLIGTIAGLISCILDAISLVHDLKSKVNKNIFEDSGDFRYKPPRHYIDIYCQDINPADDSNKNPMRQSLREKTWEWLFDPDQDNVFFLLLGDFGTGKTTFCYYIANEIINTTNLLTVKIIRLGGSNLNLIEKLKTISQKKREKTLLILDAYDEYHDRGKSEDEFEMLKKLTDNFCKVLVTSRTNYFTSYKSEPHLNPRYISLLDEKQVKQFLKKNYPLRWRQYWYILNESQQFKDLSRRLVLLNYLDLKIMQSIQKLKNDKTLSNYEIYSKIVNERLLEDRNDKELLPKTVAIQIMSLLGFDIICLGGHSQIHYDSIVDKLSKLLKELKLSSFEMAAYIKESSKIEKYSRLVSEIRTRTFLIRDNPGNYRFAHQSFAEYFAARFIFNMLPKNELKIKIKFQIPSMVFTFLKEAYMGNKESLKLRKTANTISSEQIKNIFKNYNFFDRYENPEGTGIIHCYRFLNSGKDKVVLDFATGLMWQQSGSTNLMKFEAAQNWLDQLNRDGFAGYHDWRLPTLEEAMSLMEPEQKNADLYIDSVFDKQQRWIWTLDPVAGGSRWVWLVLFDNGDCSHLVVNFNGYVRAVRSGQSSP